MGYEPMNLEGFSLAYNSLVTKFSSWSSEKSKSAKQVRIGKHRTLVTESMGYATGPIKERKERNAERKLFTRAEREEMAKAK